MRHVLLLALLLSAAAAQAQSGPAAAAAVDSQRTVTSTNPGCTTSNCSTCRPGYGCGVRAAGSQQACTQTCARCPAGYTSRSGAASSNWCFKAPGKCAGLCGQANIAQAGGGSCSCDWWAQNAGDSCDASKDAACPDFNPRLNKGIIGSCRSNLNVLAASGSSKCSTYRPGQCYCDQYCNKAADCCRDCPKECGTSGIASNSVAGGNSTTTAAAAAAATPAGSTAAQAAAASIAQQVRAVRLASQPDLAPHDCGSNLPTLAAVRAAAAAAGVVTASTPWTAATGQQFSSLVDAEAWLQQCQAAEKGPPIQPYRLPVNWVQAVYCTDAAKTQCTGNEYGVDKVWQQVNILNDKFARTGIQFDWDGKIQVLYVPNPVMDEYDCVGNPSCIECSAKRAGDKALNVMTTPGYVAGYAVGQAMYPWHRKFDSSMPACADWIQILWSSLPGLGARSSIDNGLMDGGGTLAHEVGHYLGLYHTWYQGSDRTPPREQCASSASLQVNDIVQGLSDGVRDTPAISLNTTGGGKILRFVNCGAYDYTNSSALAQQSCTSATANFLQGDRYYNPYFNFMSYGDKSCIRVITPGQAARMRCSHRCFRLGNCSL